MTKPWGWKDVSRTVTESVGVGATKVSYVTKQVPKANSTKSGGSSSNSGARSGSRRSRRPRGAGFGTGKGVKGS